MIHTTDGGTAAGPATGAPDPSCDHDHDGSHVHAHGSHHAHRITPPKPGSDAARPLAIALVITAIFMVVEIIGGWLSGSLALLADAAHMGTDVAALGLALFAAWLARRPATRQRSWGFARAEILAALANAALLVAVTGWLFVETWRRLREPQPVDTGPMLWVAVAGLGANAVAAWVLSRGGAGHSHGNLNTRGALLHVLGDLLGSVAAIAAALIMMATGWWLADPILSGLIGLLVLVGAWRLLVEAVAVLMEATPPGIDGQQVHDAMAALSGVAGVHDLHIWRVASGLDALSAHVELDRTRPWSDVLTETSAVLRERFGILHVTLQPEDALDGVDPHRGCSLDTPEGMAACAAGRT
jgi:cobalt-zinc-cadmium efflux system protein